MLSQTELEAFHEAQRRARTTPSWHACRVSCMESFTFSMDAASADTTCRVLARVIRGRKGRQLAYAYGVKMMC